MGEILIGTCSWTDKTLIASGRFYPDWAKSAEARLRYYASQFPIVEVDSSYYALPSENNTQLWVERSGDGFIFNIKAFRLFTQHPTPLTALPKDIRQELPPVEKKNLYLRDLPSALVDEVWKRFHAALQPLAEAGKLGVVLFQFPSWFFPGDEQHHHILGCQERLPRYRIAVEFRHGSWVNEKNAERTFQFLRDNNLLYVCVDEPQGFRSSVPPVTEVTSHISLVRFHGRNRETWDKKGIGAAERFDYLYSEGELQEWASRLKEMASEARQLHVLFNNCHEDKAVVNAGQMRMMLD